MGVRLGSESRSSTMQTEHDVAEDDASTAHAGGAGSDPGSLSRVISSHLWKKDMVMRSLLGSVQA